MQRGLIAIDEELCTLCGECVNVCLGRILEQGEKAIIIAKPEWCNLCGHCVAICPVDAMTVGEDEPLPLPKGKAVNAEQLVYLIRARRSIRHYKAEPVPRELIEQVIEAGRFAPTGANMQGISVTAVTDPRRIDAIREKVVENLDGRVQLWESIAEANRKDGISIPLEHRRRVEVRDRYLNLVNMARNGRDVIFHGAPVVMTLHGDPYGLTPKDDADLMAMCMLLMAESLGLGTCLIGLLTAAISADETLKDLVGLPQGHQVFTSMVLGYPSLEFNKAPGRNPVKIQWM